MKYQFSQKSTENCTTNYKILFLHAMSNTHQFKWKIVKFLFNN